MKKRRKRSGNGQAFRFAGATFTKVYRDAQYAIMLDLVERMLSNPKRRKAVEDITIQLLKSMVEELESPSSPAPPS